MELPFDIVCKKCGEKESTFIQLRRNPITNDPPKLAFVCANCDTVWCESGEKITDTDKARKIEYIKKIEEDKHGF